MQNDHAQTIHEEIGPHNVCHLPKIKYRLMYYETDKAANCCSNNQCEGVNIQVL